MAGSPTTSPCLEVISLCLGGWLLETLVVSVTDTNTNTDPTGIILLVLCSLGHPVPRYCPGILVFPGSLWSEVLVPICQCHAPHFMAPILPTLVFAFFLVRNNSGRGWDPAGGN